MKLLGSFKLAIIFFLQKDLARNKSTKKHQKHQKPPKASKAQKAPKNTKKDKNASKQKHKTQINEKK